MVALTEPFTPGFHLFRLVSFLLSPSVTLAPPFPLHQILVEGQHTFFRIVCSITYTIHLDQIAVIAVLCQPFFAPTCILTMPNG